MHKSTHFAVETGSMQSLRKAQAQAEEDQYKEFHFFFSFLVLQYAYLQSIPK